MEELVSKAPQVLGPAGTDPKNRHQKYFFVKFLDPSDFPAFAYVGFRQEAVRALGRSPGAFRAYFAALLWEDRRILEELARLAHPRIRSRRAFEQFKAAYKRWAIAESTRDWSGRTALDSSAFMAGSPRDEASRHLKRQSHTRRRIVTLMHRIPFEPDRAVLIPSPTLHAIAGLSLQIHPNRPGNFYPKDELWIYKQIPLRSGRNGWILVEPQRTFDRTESGADFFTPFAWQESRGGGRLGFRKAITRTDLNEFVRLMDATPHPRGHYLETARPAAPARSSTQGRARWYRLVDKPEWPFFFVYELRFEGPGVSTLPLTHQSFIELHVTQGVVEAAFQSPRSQARRVMVTPARPTFLPATLPYDTMTYRSRRPARLLFFSRRAQRI